METNNEFQDLLQSLRLPENFTNTIGGIRLPAKPTFGKLSKHRFSRVHPGDDYKVLIYLVDDRESCLLYTSPSPRDRTRSRMPSSA